jgi:hypothetical protein
MQRLWLLVMIVVPCLAAVGCGAAGPAKVSGMVSLDGEPIEEGRIAFAPQDGQGTTAEAVITKGAYAAEVPAGKKIVKIVGMRVVEERPAYAGDPNSPMIKVTKNYVPAKFNDQSELTRDVTSSTKMDFELKSSP